ncbi:CBM96 family carbohydrate-binding protein [Blautia producta]|uniref:CBM96 family carbohydrate-binding protein n=1 Tax=Blautia producta TaxID=33035 RepID=UPI0031B577A4
MERKRKKKKAVSVTLCAVMAAGMIPSGVMAAGNEEEAVSRVAIDNPEYSRSTVLEIDGKPFWYNAIQIRVDKLIDDPNYALGKEELQTLFDQAAEDGFTVANSQIRWTDVQPNQEIYASESSYVYGGENADTAYKGVDGIQIQNYAADESMQALGYVKFKVDAETVENLDGAKLRFFNLNKLGSARKIEIYAIKDDSWTQETLTWNNAPGHEGYEVKGDDVELVAQTDDSDKMNSQNFYDFNIVDYIKQSDWAKDGTISFVIRESTEGKKTPIKLGDYDDNNYEGSSGVVDARAQFVYSDADSYDFTYLDNAIDYAKNAGMKFEVLWFGTDTCSISTSKRIPVHALMNYQKTLDDDEARTPIGYKSGYNSITGVYNYLMCKNDEGLREKEANALRATFEHIKSRGDDVVIGCQVSNEPGVGLLHGSGKTPHCMCDTCLAKQEALGVDDSEFREVTMWEYNNNLAKAVKESGYSVWTRMNLAESADTEGVAYNEKMRNSEQGTYLDFIGIDHYRKTPAQLATEGIAGKQFAQGKNLTMLMELGQKDDRANGLYLGEDVLATLSGGTFVTIYDASSSDGCEIYSYDQSAKTFSPTRGANETGEEAVVTGLFKTNNMLKKIGYDLATKAPGAAGDYQLVYFNPTSTATGSYTQKEVLSNKEISFQTDTNGIGIAVNKNENEIALLSTKGDSFTFENAQMEDVVSAELGAYDENDNWVKDKDFTLTETDGKVMASVPAYQCLRIVTKEGSLGSAEDKVDVQVEAEQAYEVSEGVTTEILDNYASGDGWLKAAGTKIGDSVTITVMIPEDGIYSVDTCYYKNAGECGTVQLSVDGKALGTEIDMSAGTETFPNVISGEINLTAGEHKLTYTLTGGKGMVIPLDYVYLLKTGNIVDKSELQTLYDECAAMEQGDYTDASWNDLQTALAAAQAVLDKEMPGSSEVDTQIQLLQDAVSNLLVKTDKTREELYVEMKSVLDEAQAEILKTEIYTEKDVNEAKAVIDAVQAFYDGDRDDPAVTAEKVATELSKLQTALDILKSKAQTPPVDKTGLNTYIAMVEGLIEEDYTASSWNILIEKLNLARTIAEDEKATQEVVTVAYKELVMAWEALVPSLNTSSADPMIAEAERVLAEADKYRPSDIENVTAALQIVKDAIAAEGTTQEELNSLVMSLCEALNNLKEQVDASDLQKMAELADSLLADREKYTSSSADALENALNDAASVLEDENRTQEQVSGAYQALTNAMAGLQKRGNKEVMEPLLEKAGTVLAEASKYSAASLEGLQEALEAAQGVYDNEDAMQKEINQAASALAQELAQVRILGDVNNDGKVDTADAANVLAANAELEELDDASVGSADVNRDGFIDTKDAAEIQKYAAELITEF